MLLQKTEMMKRKICDPRLIVNLCNTLVTREWAYW